MCVCVCVCVERERLRERERDWERERERERVIPERGTREGAELKRQKKRFASACSQKLEKNQRSRKEVFKKKKNLNVIKSITKRTILRLYSQGLFWESSKIKYTKVLCKWYILWNLKCSAASQLWISHDSFVIKTLHLKTLTMKIISSMWRKIMTQ